MKTLPWMSRTGPLLGAGLVLLIAGPLSHAADTIGPSPALEREGLSLLNSRCTICHTADLVTQQRLDRTLWTKEVDKMMKWGAPLAASERDHLIEYLSAFYNPTSPDRPVKEAKPSISSSRPSDPVERLAGNASRGDALFQKNCAACHGPKAAGGNGPRLAGNPILTQEEAFWRIVLDGQGGMPPWKGILASQDIADVLAWLRAL